MTAQEESQVLLVKEEAFEADERRHNGRYRRFLLRGVAFGAACVVVCWATVGLPLLQPNSAEDGAAEVPHPFFDEQSLSEKFSLLDCKRTCARICPVLRDRLAQYRVRSAKEVPSRFGLDLTFYKKYVNVMGIPVLSSDLVCDCVLQKAAWIVHGTTSHLKRMPEVLKKMVQNKHRVAIMARSEKTTDVPEHARLKPKDFWDRRARGLGATPHAPCSSAGEESVMCESFKTNGYFGENIFLHELTHGLARTGFKFLKWDGQDWDDYNGAVYKASLEKGLWKNTYAATNKIEFFGEAVQAWFDANLRPPECAKDNHITNGIHNCFHDRQKLRTYDPGLYQHIAGVFKDGSWRPGHSESCGCGHPDAIVEGFAAVDADGNLKDGGGSADGTGGITPSPDDDSSEVPVPTEQCLELKTHASSWPGLAANGTMAMRNASISALQWRASQHAGQRESALGTLQAKSATRALPMPTSRTWPPTVTSIANPGHGLANVPGILGSCSIHVHKLVLPPIVTSIVNSGHGLANVQRILGTCSRHVHNPVGASNCKDNYAYRVTRDLVAAAAAAAPVAVPAMRPSLACLLLPVQRGGFGAGLCQQWLNLI
eukprot:CAMPEP_0172660428 /NCGR_PEP_ID=MMETSP1074-20121228/4059_1 /TAXON_ID=2916 /ORGANISM="Ceratium fusus, Strain PA161109" /LENGTH=598 /DNA_ID=CAMNT_0013476047 /DNA_START=44 /DNA_END=1841 /DNA_ORIENTATION=-